MPSFSVSKAGEFTSNHLVPVETYLSRILQTGDIRGYYKLSEASGAASAADSGPLGYTSTALAGVTFGSGGINNSLLTSAKFTGSTGASYIQLEDSGTSSRFRMSSAFTLAIWFYRQGNGSNPTSGTGTGGITGEPLIMKGMAQFESDGLNCNFALCLEALGTDYYLSADYEIGTSPGGSNFPTGRNGRMIDFLFDAASDTFTTKTNVGVGSTLQHWFENGDRVRIGGTAITGITAGTWYYVINTNQAAGTFKLSATNGGASVNGTTNITTTGAWLNHARGTNVFNPSTMNNTWNLAVCTWDGTRLKTYLNGALAELEYPTMKPPEANSTQLAAISAGITSAAARSGGFNGLLQHALLLSRPMTDSEILNLYNQGMQVRPPAVAAPSAALSSSSSIFAGYATEITIVLTDSSSGIDHASVTSGSVVVTRDGDTLILDTDYSFAYSAASQTITLTPIGNGGIFLPGEYVVTLN